MKLFIISLFLALSLLTFSAVSDADPLPAASSVPVAMVGDAQPPMVPSVVAVAEPAAPPQWAQDVMTNAQALPVVGPILTKALMYLGIVISILTSLVGFLLGVLKTLQGVLSYAGLSKAAEALVGFQNGRIMYYLKFFSMFNAKAPAPEKSSA